MDKESTLRNLFRRAPGQESPVPFLTATEKTLGGRGRPKPKTGSQKRHSREDHVLETPRFFLQRRGSSKTSEPEACMDSEQSRVPEQTALGG